MVLRSRTDHVAVVSRKDPSPTGADLVVDCTGSPEGFGRAIDAVGAMGTVVLKSSCAVEATVPSSLLTRAMVKEVTVVGSRCGTRDDFETALRSLVAGTVDVEPLVETKYPLAQFERAFEHAARPRALKVLLDLT
jgi:threonine dehydrogenase-like Zn-dependent dehydrogenase